MRFFFVPFDLVPIGIATAAVFLCIWSYLKAKAKPAKIISAATALVFILSIPTLYYIRYEKRWYSYTVEPNIMIRNGKSNQCPQDKVQIWTDWTIKFWLKHFEKECILDGLRNDLIICKDQKLFVLGTMDKIAVGFTYGDLSFIGYSKEDPNLTEHVYKHEISHNILFRCYAHKKECAQHAYFKQVGFPY